MGRSGYVVRRHDAAFSARSTFASNLHAFEPALGLCRKAVEFLPLLTHRGRRGGRGEEGRSLSGGSPLPIVAPVHGESPGFLACIETMCADVRRRTLTGARIPLPRYLGARPRVHGEPSRFLAC